LLSQQKDPSAQLALVQQANHSMNIRRAQARQDADRKRMWLDKKNVFTKHANETRMSSEIEVKIHRNHNLKKVLKDVRLNARRRRGIAPGAATEKVTNTFTPKIPPKYKVLAALEASQSDRELVDEETLRKHRSIIARSAQVKRLKHLSGGGIAIDLDHVKADIVESDDDEENSATSSLSFASVGQIKYEDKKAISLPPLPSLEERYGLGTNQFSAEPVCLNYKDASKSIERLEEQLKKSAVRKTMGDEDDAASKLSISSVYTNHTGVESFDAKQLKKKNLMLLQYMQIPDPRINSNVVRKKAAKSKTSMIDVEKFVEIEEDRDEYTEEIFDELQRWYHHNGLGLGPEFNVLPFVPRETRSTADLGDFMGRMKSVWDCCNLIPIHLRMDTDLLFHETVDKSGTYKKDEFTFEEYCETFECTIDGLFHLQVLAMRYEKETGLEKLSAMEGNNETKAPKASEAKAEAQAQAQTKKKAAQRRKKGARNGDDDDKKKENSAIANCLPSETIVFLMNTDLYMSPVPGQTPLQWIQAVAKVTLDQTRADAHRVSVLSEQLGNFAVKEWILEAVQKFVQPSFFGIKKIPQD